MNYTKGEWKTTPTDSQAGVGQRIHKKGDYYYGIALVYGTDAQGKANANLIAAAPDMYQELKNWYEWWNEWVNSPAPTEISDPFVAATERVLAKAEVKE